ncbi:putative squamosa promoter-binding-like protein [Helianthus annuus]|nr:putative squamosa promoter-binding-like protein [Helianthus annuus]KAJ0634291.1 putative squamosa promoter-binding-like protein [Helianthus annuus]
MIGIDFTVWQNLMRKNAAVVDGFLIIMQDAASHGRRQSSLIQQTCLHRVRQQLSFQSRPAVSSTWKNSSNSTYSIATMKTKQSGILDGISQLPNAGSMPTISFSRPVPSKGTSGEVLDQGFKESLSPNVDALRALSLLSNNSWGLYEPDLIRLDQPHPMGSDNPFMVQPGLQTVPQGLPLSSSDYWQTEQHSLDPTKTSNAANTQVQEFQLFNRFYSNPMDEIL